MQVKGMLAALVRPIGPPRIPTIPCDDQEVHEVKAILDELGWN